MAMHSNIPWEQYLRDCGYDAQEANSARAGKVFREKYHRKVFTWSGTVQSIDDGPEGAFTLGVVMEPRDRNPSGDLTIEAGNEFGGALLALNKGDKIKFEVEILMQGGWFLLHSGRLVRIEKQVES